MIAYNYIICYSEKMDTLLNVNQVAFILKVHPLTIRRYIKEGKLKAIRAGGNIRIKESDLVNFNSKEVSPTPKSADETQEKVKKKPAKIFTQDDPLIQLKGRGASLYQNV